ncbi:MAG: dipeptide epimerase, partial [Aeoliella sp.]
MRISQFTAYVIRVPLKRPFRHASAVRSESDNLLVRCELVDGTIGWGEGVPRKYVTGETPDGCLEQFAATPIAEQLANDCDNWPEVIALCDRFEPTVMVVDSRGCHGNSLRAAVELSLLDAYGKLLGEPVRNVVEHLPAASTIRAQREQVQYSTTIDAEDVSTLWRSALKMRLYGFVQCKVKVGADADADAERLATIRRWIGPRVDLRVDANEAWRPENLIERVTRLLPSGISCVEQPLPHEDLPALGDLRKELRVPVMLDESLTSLQDAAEAIRLDACDFFNIRISKCGGFLNSVRLAAVAHKHGIGYQLGCHPGETGILSAAGRSYATAIGDIRYLEGSYDRHVLAESITTRDLT